MRLHTAAWLMCRIRGVRLKQCAFNCSWLYWGAPQGMLSDANPLMPYRCDMLAICGRSFSSNTPRSGEALFIYFFCRCSEASSQFHHPVLMCHCTSIKEISYASHYLHQNLTRVRTSCGTCSRLLFDLANTWEAFYKWIVPRCIHNVLKEIVKTPTRRNKINALTSGLKMSAWETLGAVGTRKLPASRRELRKCRWPTTPGELSGFIFILSAEIWIYCLFLTELWSTCSTDRGGNKAADM